MINLAVDIAKKIVQTEIKTNEDALKGIMVEALAKISDSDRVIIKVNKENIDEFRDMLPFIKTKLPGIRNINVAEDITVEPGGCAIETDFGFIDATVNTKLSIIKQAMYSMQQDNQSNA